MTVRVQNSYSNEKIVQNGVPQGSVLSPLIFNIMIHDLQKEIQNSNLMQFADDTSLTKEITLKRTKSKQNPYTFFGIELLQEDLTRTELWFKKWGFQLAPNKTQAIVFSKPNHRSQAPTPKYPELRLGNTPITYLDSVKFLGVTFSRDGTYKEYMNSICKQAKSGVNLMRAISGHTWGAHLKPMLQIYHAHVMSKMLYAAPILLHAAKDDLEKLRIIQTNALRVALGCPMYTPINSVYAETGQMPIQNIIKVRAAAYFCKLQAHADPHPTKSVLMAVPKVFQEPPIIQKTTQDLLVNSKLDPNQPVSPFSIPDTPPWKLSHPNIDLSLTQTSKHTDPNLMKIQFDELRNTKYKDHHVIFTDGSLDPDTGKAGMGIYFPHHQNHVVELPNHITIFTAELFAIKTAINKIGMLARDTDQRGKFLIATDSLSSLQAIQGLSVFREDLVNKILLKVTKAKAQGVEIDLMWVPSHIGIRGNERADELAKKAVNPHKHTKLKYRKWKGILNITAHEKINQIKQSVRLEWENTCQAQICSTRALLDSLPSRKPVTLPGSRKQQALLHRLRLGGERNLFRQKNPNYTCNCKQNMPVTTSHILLECELNQNTRSKVINTLKEMQEEFTFKTLLNPPKPFWNAILQQTARLVQTHPQGKDL